MKLKKIMAMKIAALLLLAVVGAAVAIAYSAHCKRSKKAGEACLDDDCDCDD